MPVERRDDTAASIARFGTAQETPRSPDLRFGPVRLETSPDGLGPVFYDGVEVLRGLAYPVRDADWATLPAATVDETRSVSAQEAAYEAVVRAGDFDGRFGLKVRQDGDTVVIAASVGLTASTASRVNRAGFVLLHPLAGVVGRKLTVTHSDGTRQTSVFPERVSPGQPVFDIAGLTHDLRGVRIDIAFEGEVFEMEDQRNWTDASFKTYCRPLGAPRPFDVRAGETISQRVTIRLSGRCEKADAGAESVRRGVVPEIALAIDESIQPIDENAARTLAPITLSELQLRIRADRPRIPEALRTLGAPLALEIELPNGTAAGQTLAAIAATCAAADMTPVRVMALPDTYLASHQPEGPWPDGITPQQAADAARAAFPDADIGAGMLTNFTELNRCPPRHPSDYVTFGTTAIVHDAQDRAVLETLEAMPDIFASAEALAEGRPVRLGLVSIGMRDNPYGAAVAANPNQIRLAMAQADPRQRGLFAAAFAVGIVAVAAEAGVRCLAPAMATGPLGLVHRRADWPQPGYRDDEVYPLFHTVRALAALTGKRATIEGAAPGGVVTIRTPGATGLCGLATNLGPKTARLDPGRARVAVLSVDSFGASHHPAWLDRADRRTGPIDLDSLDTAFLFAQEPSP